MIKPLDLRKYIGWVMMVIYPEDGSRYAGLVVDVREDAGEARVLTSWTMVDNPISPGWSVMHKPGENEKPVQFWHGSFEDPEEIQPQADNSFIINHSVAEQVIVLYPPADPMFLELQTLASSS